MASGAFKFVSRQLNQGMTLQHFDDFFDPARPPNFKTLIFQVIPGESTRVAGVQTGSLDIALGLSAEGALQLQGSPGVNLTRTDDATLVDGQIDQLAFPLEPSPLLDVRVRQAPLMAVDRAVIAKSFYKRVR
jgi:peptide/nickel transport system substrate-binding protein